MVLLCPKLNVPISKLCHTSPKLVKKTFIPFSIIQERKLFESKLVTILHRCTNLVQIKQVHAQILRKGLEQCCYVLTKLVRMVTELDTVPVDTYPRLVFNQVENPGPFLWTALIRGYSRLGNLKESIFLYNCMRRECVCPVSFTFTAILKGCTFDLDVYLGRQIHGQAILLGGFVNDLYVGNTLIDMYVKCGDLNCARNVFDEMFERDAISWTSLIVAYAKSGDMKAASKMFDGLPVKDMVAWTAMVTGYVQNAQPREALEYFERLRNVGVGTDEVTLVGAISACAQLGAAKYANVVRDIAEKSDCGPRENVRVGSALIDMYSKCGNVDEAYKVFEGMRDRNVYSYSSMIVGFAMHGRANAAMRLFHEMLITEIKPNKVTFIGVLTACSHAGMVEQGREIFSSMENIYGVPKSVDHYSVMVDLLGRAGCLEEAMELVMKMPIKPNGGVWGAMLGACRIHGNPDIAEIAASHLFEREPENIGNYLLLSNIYALAGRWNDVIRVRKLMREKGLKKNPGCSWVETKKGIIHEFFAGDMDHPKSMEIKQALKNLLERLSSIGYQPNLSCVPYDVSDDDKKRILMGHSEKLALAFGLISNSVGSKIHIVKNLRICEDCHSVMCGASEITGREIIIRDNMRFHHFRNGVCSCNNFW